jgi:hypothetical protein
MVDTGEWQGEGLGVEQAKLALAANCLGAAADMKLTEDVIEMLFDRANRDDQEEGHTALFGAASRS